MKKYLTLIIVVCILLITGCSKEKELVCTKDVSSNGIKIVQTTSMKFISDKVENMNIGILITLPDSYKAHIDTFTDHFKKEYESKYASYNHVKLATKKEGNSKISIDMVFDYKNMTKEEKEDLNLSGSEKYSDNKEALANQGFTCK